MTPYQNVCQKMQKALEKARRSSQTVQLVAVSKGQEASSILDLYGCGQKIFAENYVQEWQAKRALLAKESNPPFIRWHFTGRLQTNKLKYLIGEIELFHSIDRLSLAEKMNQIAQKKGVICQGLVEIDLAQEPTKTGFRLEELEHFFKIANDFSSLEIKGLMVMPPATYQPETSRPFFTQLRQTLEDLNRKAIYRKNFSELSMGMSQDFEVALEEGATLIRVGRALFNTR